jgi:hypothetical protein
MDFVLTGAVYDATRDTFWVVVEVLTLYWMIGETGSVKMKVTLLPNTKVVSVDKRAGCETVDCSVLVKPPDAVDVVVEMNVGGATLADPIGFTL